MARIYELSEYRKRAMAMAARAPSGLQPDRCAVPPKPSTQLDYGIPQQKTQATPEVLREDDAPWVR